MWVAQGRIKMAALGIVSPACRSARQICCYGEGGLWPASGEEQGVRPDS